MSSELQKMKIRAGVLHRVDCTDKENAEFALELSGQLPEGVYPITQKGSSTGKFFKLIDNGLKGRQLDEYLLLKQLDLLEAQANAINSIKSMVSFFVILAVLGLFMGFLGIIGAFR